MAWFQFTGSNPTEPADYTLNPSPSCGGTDQICAVQADNAGGQPVLTEALKNEMIIALNNRNPSTNVQLKD
ncbi:hypothetical protein [Sphingobacterium pedocola]|uniref:Uncharacterized protein n=1 Tax=Sphingobacterium pedocola TaxID=2082722 RepID=A0ABR9T3M7_9SPHI|nr:hypothetical protein [Sphingobacterium pedocola]MBE8719954.1 hypothetical protein [Sphingobacterium pedocola]